MAIFKIVIQCEMFPQVHKSMANYGGYVMIVWLKRAKKTR